MNFLYLATLNDLKDRRESILEIPLWDEMDMINGNVAIQQIEDELSLRNVWAE